MRRNEKRVKGPCIGEDDSDEDEKDNKERDNGKSDEDSNWGEEHDKTLCYGDVTLLSRRPGMSRRQVEVALEDACEAGVPAEEVVVDGCGDCAGSTLVILIGGYVVVSVYGFG